MRRSLPIPFARVKHATQLHFTSWQPYRMVSHVAARFFKYASNIVSPVFLLLPNTPMRSRILIHIQGQVQGVGFRPFVYRLATEIELTGWVLNDGNGVEIEAEGESSQLLLFVQRLRSDAPPLARIARLCQETLPVSGAAAAFAIRDSLAQPAGTAIAPDSAVCIDCLAELFDPGKRRYRHPFINCTNCGPRYTITARLPYDRVNTCMANFAQCPDCLAEYRAPLDRRFHAQANGCHACGPRLRLLGRDGVDIDAQTTSDVIAAALARILGGEIVAIKGLGGFHLVCDARNANAVRTLRLRKQREEKPFALMFANLASVREFALCNDEQAALLCCAQRPIVLLQKLAHCDDALAGVAAQLPTLGAMLPTTPIQYLLFHQACGKPQGMAWLEPAVPLVLVATSANAHGEPLVIDNQQAMTQLAGMADAFVIHEREILMRCDDSVLKCHPTTPGPAQMLRRARGYVPAPLTLKLAGPPGLAVGAYLNNTICVCRADAGTSTQAQAFVSQHIGDLDSRSSCEVFGETLEFLLKILNIAPQWVAADLHEDFYSTRFARAFADKRNLPFFQVQHHHAHIAAVLAEHGLQQPVLGLALDGFGRGDDGGAWGGELLRVDGARMRRLGHLQPLALPGADRAAREPWRMAAAALFALGRADDIATRCGVTAQQAAGLRTMLTRGVNCPPSTSAGRLFDAAAGLLRIKNVCSYEGQAANMLEGIAQDYLQSLAGGGAPAPLADAYRIGIDDNVLNFLPLLGQLDGFANIGHASAAFHATVAAGLAQWVLRAALNQGIDCVVLNGGCFFNGILASSLRALLEAQGLHVYEACLLPCGDGGISLGQAWVALHR